MQSLALAPPRYEQTQRYEKSRSNGRCRLTMEEYQKIARHDELQQQLAVEIEKNATFTGLVRALRAENSDLRAVLRVHIPQPLGVRWSCTRGSF